MLPGQKEAFLLSMTVWRTSSRCDQTRPSMPLIPQDSFSGISLQKIHFLLRGQIRSRRISSQRGLAQRWAVNTASHHHFLTASLSVLRLFGPIGKICLVADDRNVWGTFGLISLKKTHVIIFIRNNKQQQITRQLTFLQYLRSFFFPLNFPSFKFEGKSNIQVCLKQKYKKKNILYINHCHLFLLFSLSTNDN